MTSSASKHSPAIFLMTNTFETGGSERQFTILVSALRERDVRVEVGCLARIGAFQSGQGEVAQFPCGGSLYGWRSWTSRFTLARYLRARRIEVAHAFDFYTNLMLIPAARLARIPVVLGSHRQLGDLLGASRFRAQNLSFRLCDRVICNSRAAAQSLLDQGLPQRKIEIIPNGLSADVFVPVQPALPQSPATLRVGMIARMNNPVKNYPGFLRAAALLAPKFPHVEFVLVGDGPLRPEIERLSKSLGLEGRALFLGDRQDIPAVLASLDISVLNSFSESLSNSILESMAAGLPVVATNVGGNADLVREGETGFLVPSDNEIALANAIEQLLARPDLRSAFGKRAREIARENYSVEGVVERYTQLYLRLLSAKRGAKSANNSSSRPASRFACPMQVAVVAPSLRYTGGQSAQAILLLEKWKGDAEVQTRFIPADPDFPGILTWTQKIPLLRTIVRTPLYLAALWHGLKGADVAHVFSASYWSFLLAPFPALAIAKLRGVKVLLNYHSGEAKDHLSRWRSALPILRRADCLVVPSNYLGDVFREFGLHARVVPNAVDESQFKYRLRQPLEPRLVCTRGFGAYYRVDHVVRAFARVQQAFPEATLSLPGVGPEEAGVRSLVEELRLSRVDFPGAVAREQMGLYYDRADIFINASWLDNMPLSILEAFASGTPVVSTAPEGIRYLVRHEQTGLLCEPNDWEALAANVIRLLGDPALAVRLSQNAYEESKKYRWETVRSQWLEVYSLLLGRESSVPATTAALKGESCATKTTPQRL
ncbi:MAG TPA: glycosyltransferase [Terriglobia bacterium]|nr:glycosyltransferase [Terriglobia bacterium]